MLVPFWLVVTFVKMEGGTWREAFEVWPGALVSGGSFALVQFLASGSASFHLITDVVAGVVSIIITALFLRFVWHPKKRFLLKTETAREWAYRYTAREAGGAAGREAGGGALHAQLAIRSGHGRVRGRADLGSDAAADGEAMDDGHRRDGAAHARAGARHRPSPRPRLPHALLRRGRRPRPRLHQRRRDVPVLRR